VGNLANFMNTLVTTWQAATAPVDSSGLSYTFVDSFDEERGHGTHRQLVWRMPSHGDVIGEAALQVEWLMSVDLFSQRDHAGGERTQDAFIRGTVDEVIVLVNAWSAVTAWGSKVLEAHLEDWDTEDSHDENHQRSGGLKTQNNMKRTTFNFRVLIAES
jgi:hypothetical protein